MTADTTATVAATAIERPGAQSFVKSPVTASAGPVTVWLRCFALLLNLVVTSASGAVTPGPPVDPVSVDEVQIIELSQPKGSDPLMSGETARAQRFADSSARVRGARTRVGTQQRADCLRAVRDP
jgi:hypothetical protein